MWMLKNKRLFTVLLVVLYKHNNPRRRPTGGKNIQYTDADVAFCLCTSTWKYMSKKTQLSVTFWGGSEDIPDMAILSSIRPQVFSEITIVMFDMLIWFSRLTLLNWVSLSVQQFFAAIMWQELNNFREFVLLFHFFFIPLWLVFEQEQKIVECLASAFKINIMAEIAPGYLSLIM